MSLFYTHYGCHEGALVMEKSTGAIFQVRVQVRGNVSLWDMTAVLELWDPEHNRLMYTSDELDNDRELRKKAVAVARSKEFEERYLILDEGEDRLSLAFKSALSQITSNK